MDRCAVNLIFQVAPEKVVAGVEITGVGGPVNPLSCFLLGLKSQEPPFEHIMETSKNWICSVIQCPILLPLMTPAQIIPGSLSLKFLNNQIEIFRGIYPTFDKVGPNNLCCCHCNPNSNRG